MNSMEEEQKLLEQGYTWHGSYTALKWSEDPATLAQDVADGIRLLLRQLDGYSEQLDVIRPTIRFVVNQPPLGYEFADATVAIKYLAKEKGKQ